MTLVKTFQWEDWRDLRLSDTGSEAYRRGIGRLAKRLSDANAQLVDTGIAKSLNEPMVARVDEPDDTPGLLDLLANMEESLPKVTATLQSIAGCTARIGEIMAAGSEKVLRADSQGKGFGARILIAKKMARELADPVDQMQFLTNSYASELYDVDQGTRVIIELASRQLDEAPEGREEICAFFAQVKNLASNASKALESVQGLIDGSGPIEAMSRDLRPVLKRHRQALTAMVEATQVMNEWVKLIDMSGIDCEGVDSPSCEELNVDGGR